MVVGVVASGEVKEVITEVLGVIYILENIIMYTITADSE